MIEVFHSFQEVCDPVQSNVNIFIACFTTSYARLKLYDALDILKERVFEILQPEDDQRTLTLHNPHKITRCAATKTIKTVSQDKKYKLVFDKRVIDHDTFQSFPYGYKCIFTPRI
ncbi:unnamed protein product [Pocillopora meandrina]|uniref:Uncharacterized protein n=1 Tax=Pocillopora meandrina TaxID=46732 RepID=A0AAU9XTG9_9CNID|nr:unnamed protein product [Pocillopora meandrina]